MRALTNVLTASITVVALTACGGGSSSSSSTSNTTNSGGGGGGGGGGTFSEVVTVTASLGHISDASVTIYNAAFDQIIGSGELDENGQADIHVTYNNIEPAIVVVTAGESSTYFDEAAGELTLTPGTQFHAITTDPRDTAVTPLTELAWHMANTHNLLPLDSTEVRLLNNMVSEIFTGHAIDITATPTVLSEMPAPNSMAATEANLHAALLAALAKMGEGQAEPVLATLAALKVDIEDGFISSATTFRAELENWVATYGNSAAQTAIFALPLAENVVDGKAGVSAQSRVDDIESGIANEVAYSIDGSGEWADFPKESTVTIIVRDGIVGLAEGDHGMDYDTADLIPGWSVSLDGAEYLDVTDQFDTRSIRVRIPTGDALTKRYFYFLRRGDSDLDSVIITEDDLLTSGSHPDRIAHILNFKDDEYLPPYQELAMFDDLHAKSGTNLTVIESTVDGRACTVSQIGTLDNDYPKYVGLIHASTAQEKQPLMPQRIRYTENGDQREILFSDEMLIRQNTVTGRIDFIYFSAAGDITQWATNHPSLISDNCD